MNAYIQHHQLYAGSDKNPPRIFLTASLAIALAKESLARRGASPSPPEHSESG